MRTWVKWTSLAAVGLAASSAIAADHGDPQTMGADPAADIADVYAWMSDSNKLTLIQTIPAANLSDSVYYVFHIGRQMDAAGAATAWGGASETKVICWMEMTDQTTCVVDHGTGDTVDFVQGLAADELPNTEGTLKVHVGAHADPFFFYLTGFNQARENVFAVADAVGGAGNLQLTMDGCPQAVEATTHPNAGTGNLLTGTNVDVALLGLLNGTFENATTWSGGTPGQHAVDDLGTNDVTGIVMEIDTSLLAGSGDYFQVWASTHVRN